MFNKFSYFLKEHWLAFSVAVFVGLIYIAPNIFFIFSLGNAYKGIPIMQTANEDAYLVRMQEILDGHWSLSSPFFFEYKNQEPLQPPGGELFYVILSILLNISLINVLIASRFFLPFILFLLIYFFIKCLLIGGNILPTKINAIAGALFVTLGYDLIDFRTVLGYLKGGLPPGDFLIWSRPVNPILGAIFLFSFLIFLWNIAQKDARRKKIYIICASIFLSLMITSYFFSWGMALSIAAVLALIYLLKKEYKTVKNIVISIILGFLLSLPYWYISWRASQSPWYPESVLRSGLFRTHYPLLNKFMLAVLGIYLIFIFLPVLIKWIKKKKINIHFDNWHLFCLAFILGSLWAYGQQVVTGMTIWPYHFVQYSIPLAIIVLMVLFYNIVREKSQFLWKAGIFIIIFASFIFGIYTQASTYRRFYPYYLALQSYSELFNWINRQEKDCVILVKDEPEIGYDLNGLIPAFTHCNVYNSSWLYSLIDPERPQHNYFTRMILNGVTAQNINQHLQNNKGEAQGYLLSDWKELYGVKDFPDIPNRFGEKLKKIPEDYKKFFAGDLKSELKKYRLDYILIKGKVAGKAADLIKNLNLVYTSGDIFVYQFK